MHSRIAVISDDVQYQNVSYSHLHRVKMSPSIAAKLKRENEGASMVLGIEWTVVTNQGINQLNDVLSYIGGVLMRDIEVEKCIKHNLMPYLGNEFDLNNLVRISLFLSLISCY